MGDELTPLPPDGGYGWVIVGASFMCNVIIDGMAFSVGILNSEFLRVFGEGKGKTAWIGSLLSGYGFVGEWCRVVCCDVMSCAVVSCRVVWCAVVSCHVTSDPCDVWSACVKAGRVDIGVVGPIVGVLS